MNPTQELARDLKVSTLRAAQLAKAHGMPVRLTKRLRERIADVRAETIRKAAGAVC
jgi:hypothetical protein